MRGIKGNTKDDFMYTISYSKFWDVIFNAADLIYIDPMLSRPLEKTNKNY